MVSPQRSVVFSMLSISILACGSDPTQVIVVVDTDFSIPGQLDGVRISVRNPDGEIRAAEGPLDPSEPRTLAQTHTQGPLGPFQVTVEGTLAGALVITREASFDFQTGRRLTLVMHLLRSCETAMCPPSETCSAGGCRPIRISPGELTPWQGPARIVRADGGGIDGCVPTVEVCDSMDQDCDGRIDEGTSAEPEICNESDDDCDSMIDEDFNKLTDPLNCGGCGITCTFPEGMGSCQAGMCRLIGCNAGFADCDMDGVSCESNTMTSTASCGDCTTTCSPPDPDCCDGVCGRCT